MKNKVDTKNKLFAGIFIFLASIYVATLIHELGHLITYIFLGCKSANVWVSPLIFGRAVCYSPKGFDVIGFLPNLLARFSGIFFVSILGIILFLLYRYSKYVRNHYVLSLISYFFAFNFLLNGFLQSISGGDFSELIFYISPLFLYGFAGIIGLILLFHIFKFKELILLIEPKTKQKTVKIMRIGFLILFLLISLVYFLI